MMTGKCAYCDRDGVEIVQSHPSESTNAICAECEAHVVLLRPDEIVKGLRSRYLYEVTPHAQVCLLRALEFVHDRRPDIMVDRPLDGLPDLIDRTCERERVADFNRLRSLMRVSPREWMPVKVNARVRVSYRFDPVVDYTHIDGIHRICAAAAWGAESIPVYVNPPAYRPKANPIYQTLVLPDGLIPGQRPADRWRHMPDCLIGRDLVDLACNSARDGVLHCVCCPSAHYWGYDRDAAAIEDGRAMAKAWGVADRVHLEVADASSVQRFPQAFAVILFSASKVIPRDTVLRALRESGALRLMLETHNMHDDPDSQWYLDQAWHWNFLGCTANTTQGPQCRRLFAGIPRP